MRQPPRIDQRDRTRVRREDDGAGSLAFTNDRQPLSACGSQGCCGTFDANAGAPAAARLDHRARPGTVRSRLRIQQMDCPTEESLIRNRLANMDGVVALEFNLIQRVLTLDHVADALPHIDAAIRELGMTPRQLDTDSDGDPTPDASPGYRLWFAGAAALGAELAHWLDQPMWLSAVLALLAIAACGLGTFRKGWIALRHGELNINALMSLAVSGALLIGQWPEAAMVLVLFAVAELLETRSLDRARNSIHQLLVMAPDRATVRGASGRWESVEASTVAVGARVRVRPGERIPLDGKVLSGRSSVDQAPITGESIPVEKATGDLLFAGTVNQVGELEYVVTRDASHSTLSRIIETVESSLANRAPIQRFVDRFARIYTPLVVLGAVAIAMIPPLLLGDPWSSSIYKALVLLVIACPCALVISTPVSIVSGLAAGARHGILIKGGAYLELGHKIGWLVLDKTGTITHGRPVLVDHVLVDANGVDAVDVATALALRSDHPVSRAIVGGDAARWTEELPVDQFKALPGRGVSGLVAGQRYYLGNHRLVHELGVCSPQMEQQLAEWEAQGKTTVVLAGDDRIMALFAVADTIRESSRIAIDRLHAQGVSTMMLSGDNLQTVRAIAADVGIDRALGDQLPQDKLESIAELSRAGNVVGMVGDGINDAPALAEAEIGFAMGAAGSDVAIETADVALMDDDLNKISTFIGLSRATSVVLKQNIVLALGIKTVFLVVTVLGMGTMWMAVFADMGASLLVVLNSLRLLRY